MNDDTASKERGFSDDGFDEVENKCLNQWSNPETRKKLMDPCLEQFNDIKICRVNQKIKEIFKDNSYILTPVFNSRGINKITKVIDSSKNVLSFHLFSNIEKVWWTHRYKFKKTKNGNCQTMQK